jgi:hypothetical protein
MLNINTMFPNASADLVNALDAAPTNLMAVNARIDYRDALEADDPRYVETGKARAERFAAQFYKTFGFDEGNNSFEPQDNLHVLFFGHVGCGKSTELAQLCTRLHDPARYWVVKVDLLQLLDPSNVNYSDIWLAVAQLLIEKLAQDGISIAPLVLKGLEDWFTEHVLVHEEIKDLSAEVKAQAEVGGGIPWLAKVLGQFTTALRIGSTYREQVRSVVRNTYNQFVVALNQLLLAATEAVAHADKGRQILIVIDGPDRFRGNDWRQFFVDDVNQLLMVKCVAVYAAPMALSASGARLDRFSSVVLPMIKLREFDSGVKRPDAYIAMQKILLKRCHYRLFDTVETLDALIDYSGGHLRDALRLLSYACVESDTGDLSLPVIEGAANRLAADYRSWLEKTHYPVLVNAANNPKNDGHSEVITMLVERGALLEYNSGSWQQPHPVIKLLYGYRKAQAEAEAAATPPAVV